MPDCGALQDLVVHVCNGAGLSMSDTSSETAGMAHLHLDESLSGALGIEAHLHSLGDLSQRLSKSADVPPALLGYGLPDAAVAGEICSWA